MLDKQGKAHKKLRGIRDLNIIEALRFEIISCWWLRFVLKNWNADWLVRYFVERTHRKFRRFEKRKELHEFYQRALRKLEKP